MKFASTLFISVVLALGVTQAQSGTSILFVGNSFTFGAGSPVRFYRADTVTDLNNEGIGGVPALFKSFTQQAGLPYDHYHASAHGYYLETLVIFGSITGRDPRSLGDNECSAYELGFTRLQVKALQQIAYDELAAAGTVTAAPLVLPKPVPPERCVRGH